jgi:hypothetical protein
VCRLWISIFPVLNFLFRKNMMHSVRRVSSHILFALVAISIAASAAFAGDAIPGVGVGGGKNPGGIIIHTTTDTNGKFAFPRDEAGSYTITITAADVKNMMAIAARKYHKTYGAKSCAVITLQPSSSMTVNGQKKYGPIALSSTKATTITIVLSKAGSISGGITAEDTWESPK